MRKIYFNNMLLDIKKYWKYIILSSIIMMMAFIFIGYEILTQEKTETEKTAITAYEKGLIEYDEAIATINESIAITELQVDSLQEYCDNSIYMNLDSHSIAVSNLQYAVRDSSNAGNILSSLVTYINDGGLKDKIINSMEDVPGEYLNEIISCSTNGNVLTVSVMHHEISKAEEIILIIEQLLKEYQKEVIQVQGEYTWQKLDCSSYYKADVNVLNTQNLSISNLKTYQNSLVEYQKKLIEQETSRQSYVNSYKPQEKVSLSLKRGILIYSIVGFIIGIVFAFVIIILRMVIDDRLYSKKDLGIVGLPILGNFSRRDSFCFNKSGSQCIQILTDKNKSNNIFLSMLNLSDEYYFVIENYVKELQKFNLNVSVGYSILENIDEMKQMMISGNCVLIVGLGKTTYTELKEQICLCEKFDIPILGSIVIE